MIRGFDLPKKEGQQSEEAKGVERIIIYDQNEELVSEYQYSHTFTADSPGNGFLNEVFWSDKSKEFCPATALSDPDGKYFIKVSRVYRDGQIGSDTITTEKFIPADIPPDVMLEQPENGSSLISPPRWFNWGKCFCRRCSYQPLLPHWH